jgi:O-antigen/teichoic acid export membrane protein
MNASFVRFSRQTLVGGVSTGLVYLRTLFILSLLTRSFGADGYGVWVQLFVGTELLAGVAGLGLNFALLRYIPTRTDRRHAAGDLWSVLLICGFASLILMGIGWVSAAWMARIFLGGDSQARVVQIALLLIPVSGFLNLVLIYFRAAREAGVYVWLVAAETGGWLLLSAVVFFLETGIETMVVGLLVVKGLVVAAGCGRVLWSSGTWRPRLATVAPYVHYGLPLLPLGILSWVLNASDRYLLSYFCGSEVAGIYAVSYGIGSIAGLAYAPVFFVLLPATAAAWNADRHEEVAEYLRFAQKYPFLLVVPIVLLLTWYAQETIGIVATSQFSATPALIGCVATGIVIMNIGAMAQTVLNLDYRSRRILVISVSAAAFNIIANAVVIPFYGAAGAAATTLMTYALQTTTTHLMSRSILPFPWQWGLMVKALLAATPLALGLALGQRLSAPQPVVVIIGCVAYVGVLLLSGGLEQREWRLAKAVLGLRSRDD